MCERGLRVIRGTPREHRYFYTEIHLLALRINNIGRFLRTVAQFAFFFLLSLSFFFFSYGDSFAIKRTALLFVSFRPCSTRRERKKR